MNAIDKIKDKIVAAGGWIGFEDFMHEALYAPGLGYYSGSQVKLGTSPKDGSDFVTAPELSPLFGRALAAQVRQALHETGTTELWEFGAGSGVLAAQLLLELEGAVSTYHIVEVSANLQQRQSERLKDHAGKVVWETCLPIALRGVVIGNEVLDAMPVTMLCRKNGVWHERGVGLGEKGESETDEVEEVEMPKGDGALRFIDRLSEKTPPTDIPDTEQDYLTEIHPQAEAFIASVSAALIQGGAGAMFFIDYGFPEAEYYHSQRSMGTLMCHRAHQADDNPLVLVGQKDITAHVNFTSIALAAQDAGLKVLGYTSQGHFLINCGLGDLLSTSDLPTRIMAQKLINEHEMGELFKVIGFSTHDFEAIGFAHGDRTHRL